MSGFDPLSYAAAREARPSAGVVMPALQVDASVLAQGWCQLDGSLVSRAAYPDAAKIIGDVRFFNGTPVETLFDLTMRAGVGSVSLMKFLAVGGAFIAAPQSNAASGDTAAYRLWRSPDAGANWVAVDLPAMPSAAAGWSPTSLEWFGAGRVLLVLIGTSASGTYSAAVTYSNDSGQTWSTPKQLISVATGYVTVDSVSADAEMITSGAGYYYVGVVNNSNSPASAQLSAINPGANTVVNYAIASDGTNAQRCRVIGGRVVAAGTSEVHYLTYSGSGNYPGAKLTFNGAAFSGQSSSGLVSTFFASSITNGLRQFVTKGGDGSYYWMYTTATVGKLPANWSGAITQVHVGIDNVGMRLLTNTLSNPNNGRRYDIDTGAASTITGMGAGRSKVGVAYGDSDRIWAEAVVVDKSPSNDRHFTMHNSVAGSMAVRSTRVADNFLGGLGSSPDAAVLLSPPSATYNWYDPTSGQLKSLATTGSPLKLRVLTYAPANDYATYVHLPYLPGLMARMR